MLNGVHTFWMMSTSLLDYISFAWVDHTFFSRWAIIYSLCFLKWLNLNNFPFLCDCHSLKFTDYSYMDFSTDNHWVFSYKFSWYHDTRIKMIFLKFGRPFVSYFWKWVYICVRVTLWETTLHNICTFGFVGAQTSHPFDDRLKVGWPRWTLSAVVFWGWP